MFAGVLLGNGVTTASYIMGTVRLALLALKLGNKNYAANALKECIASNTFYMIQHQHPA